MKLFICCFLFFIHLLSANNPKFPLTSLYKFDVVTFCSPYDKIELNSIYRAEEAALQQIGTITISEHDSLLTSLVKDNPVTPLCYFSISKDLEQLSLSLEISTDVEILENKHKITSSIWKKTVYSQASHKKMQENLVIRELMNELVKAFLEDWKKANEQGAPTLSFHIRKCQTL